MSEMQNLPSYVLRRGAQHLEDRAAVYDKRGERSIGATVAAFSAITGVQMTEEQGWLFMTLLKAVRSQQGQFKQDNYEDGAAYFALMCESAARDRTEPCNPLSPEFINPSTERG